MPSIHYGDGATKRDMTAIYYQDGASLRTITEAWYQDGATLRKVWPAGLTVTPAFASGASFTPGGPGSKVVTSNSVTASGASTYTWARISGSALINANSPSAAITSFSGTVLASTSISAVFRVTGNTGATADVQVDLEYSNGA